MKTCVVVFPGSNCDRDAAVALEQATGEPAAMVWHAETDLPAADLIVLPGGFSYGDYLRSGAMGATSPIMSEVVKRANDGVAVLGVCNGFQLLTEAGLLPGALLRNRDLHFASHTVTMRVETVDSPFTKGFEAGEYIRSPIAHMDGNYYADAATHLRLEGEGRVAFRYVDNPNGSERNIAGVLSENKRVLGLMPHPERALSPFHEDQDGARFFKNLVEALG